MFTKLLLASCKITLSRRTNADTRMFLLPSPFCPLFTVFMQVQENWKEANIYWFQILWLNSRARGRISPTSFDEKRPKVWPKVLILADPKRLVRKLWMYWQNKMKMPYQIQRGQSKNSEHGEIGSLCLMS